MSFGANLKKARRDKGLTQANIATQLGIDKSTYCGYETGKRQPDVKRIKELSFLLGVSADALLGTDGANIDLNRANKKSAPALSAEALDIVNRYEAATPEIKAAVRAVLSVVEVRASNIVVTPKKVIPIFNTAAGSGDPESDIGWETYETENMRADFAIHVVGNSMEPLLPDGSVALGIRRMPRDGEIGAFRLDGEFLVKQVCEDHIGNVYLFSVNRSRSDADQTIWHNSGRDLWCFGTILCDRVPLPN